VPDIICLRTTGGQAYPAAVFVHEAPRGLDYIASDVFKLSLNWVKSLNGA
jgi:hypothetical protein